MSTSVANRLAIILVLVLVLCTVIGLSSCGNSHKRTTVVDRDIYSVVISSYVTVRENDSTKVIPNEELSYSFLSIGLPVLRQSDKKHEFILSHRNSYDKIVQDFIPIPTYGKRTFVIDIELE
jgi:hypothetical protein